MIKLSNGHQFKYMVASGALGFDGRGWLWERPLVRLGLIRPALFTVVLKTLTSQPRRGNLRWARPWAWLPFSPLSCVRFVPGGAVNKVGLTNPGIVEWCRVVGPRIAFSDIPLVGSIAGDESDLVDMAVILNRFNLVGLEVNPSCPNTGQTLPDAEATVAIVKIVASVSRHPIITKLSVAQDYLKIAEGLAGVAEAVSLNSVPWEMLYSNGEPSPLWRLQKKVGGGGGGVSGRPAQKLNWPAVESLAKQGLLPVIGPDAMEFFDLYRLQALGARAISFGSIHLRKPWAPTRFVRQALSVRENAIEYLISRLN